MIGRLLCLLHIHDWGYIPTRVRENRRLPSRAARHMVQLGYEYRCRRCGVEP